MIFYRRAKTLVLCGFAGAAVATSRKTTLKGVFIDFASILSRFW
jgi:hypothetical protein